MDVWSPGEEYRERLGTRARRWLVIGGMIALSAGGWALGFWLLLMLWGLLR